ncbi:unnamed protein product, partial [Tetraodon nigroviridis]
MAAEGSGTIRSRIKNLLRSPSIKLRRRSGNARHKDDRDKVKLEKVLGITAPGNRALACDPQTGLLAYPAGCVVVLLNPQKNKQQHIFNSSRKAITTLAFSPDGKYVVTGEVGRWGGAPCTSAHVLSARSCWPHLQIWSTLICLVCVFMSSLAPPSVSIYLWLRPQSGHLPAVRVWEVSERVQVGELLEHKYGVACVAFSPNGKLIVSVGYQHDMMVNVWNWKKNVLVAANKVSSKVSAVSFSDDSSLLRHCWEPTRQVLVPGITPRPPRWWGRPRPGQLPAERPLTLIGCCVQVNSTVPLLGRSGLLGELRNNFFSDVACGRGKQASSTFCITSSGLLCVFNERRLLDKWVELRVSQATCLSLTEDLIFCGCSDGTVRAFSAVDLHFRCTLPRPHSLGTDVGLVDASQLFSSKPGSRFPDTVALTYDPASGWLSCIYSDHSVYVWDVGAHGRLRRGGKLFSALYHASCVWSVEDGWSNQPVSATGVSGGRGRGQQGGGAWLLLHLLLRQHHPPVERRQPQHRQQERPEPPARRRAGPTDGPQADLSKAGLRTLRVCPDGQHLASGDRVGVLRIHSLDTMEEILNVQAHDSEILCLEFSQPDTGLRLLATAGRDRLIHVLDAGRGYGLVQTLDEHSSSITSVRFTSQFLSCDLGGSCHHLRVTSPVCVAANEGKLRMISCGADKSVYFRTAEQVSSDWPGAAECAFTASYLHGDRRTRVWSSRGLTTWSGRPRCTTWTWRPPGSTPQWAVRTAASGSLTSVMGSRRSSSKALRVRMERSSRLASPPLVWGRFRGNGAGRPDCGFLSLKVQMDPSGLYIATSCSDKNISIFDFYSGECVASMFGHSEIVTGLKFSNDCRHLITVSGDRCVP